MTDPLSDVEASFQFLVTDFGFALVDSRRERGGLAARYSKDGVGVLVDWYPRDPLTVWLVRLVDGAFPPRDGAIRADSTLHYFDLGHLERLRGCESTGEQYTPSAENARRMAHSLRTCGGSFLLGEIDQFNDLQSYVIERARIVTIAHYGEEYARTLGW